MDDLPGILLFLAVIMSVLSGIVVVHRTQNQIRHGRFPNAQRVDLRKQGYSPRPR